jgi:hypothetical protein
MDENLLKHKQRALDMLGLMEEHQRWFRFHIFSSADTILDFGIANLVRMGVNLVWVGVESRTGSAFDKNVGVDFQELVRTLRDHGIGVLTSGILCMEHHTPDNMQEDIDFLIGLEPDMIQFMLLTGLPVTALYREFKDAGTLRQDLDYEEWHGQKTLNFRHPVLPGDQPEHWLQSAFEADYQRNGSSIGRLIETSVRGARNLEKEARDDPVIKVRHGQLLDQVGEYRPLLPVLKRFAVNDREKERVLGLERSVQELIGPRTWRDVGLGIGAAAAARVWSWRLRLLGDRIQPRTIVTRYEARPPTSGPDSPPEPPGARARSARAGSCGP